MSEFNKFNAQEISIPSNLYYEDYWLNTNFQKWSIESFDIFWIQKNPAQHKKQDQAHSSLAKELNILSEASDQRVVEKVSLLKKQLKNGPSEICDIVWSKSKEIAESQVRLSLSELITKTNVKTAIVDEIGGSGSQRYFFKDHTGSFPMVTYNFYSVYMKFFTALDAYATISRNKPNEESQEYRDRSYDNNKHEEDAISSDSDDDSQNITESMIGKVERSPLVIDNVNLENIFEDYRNECENDFDLCHSDIMDLRPTSKFAEKISDEIWMKFVSNSFPKCTLPKDWEGLINDTFKPKNSLLEWINAFHELHTISSEKKINGNPIRDVIYNILCPYIKAFEAPFNILKSGDLEENQYNAQFINPILHNTLDAICSVDWRILEVPIESSKHRRNTNFNPLFDRVLSPKRADGLARLWENREEIFLFEQIGPPDYDNLTEFCLHDYKLTRTMRDILNQRIIFQLKDGTCDKEDLASFGALGYRNEISLYWCTIHQKTYCLREFGSFKIPHLWQDLPVLSEAIIICLKFFSFMKENIEKQKLITDLQQKLFSKRKVLAVIPNPPTPNRSKKRSKM
ncbi:9654_t:CDS:10 [Cetraspora pellucida]|uniref:9654_t:CDS:1 n=1 Tax=Cetraspora pellucida TaxID=1433469 RepID=A0A9N9IIW9_9GLOM|nr:9654_t:CDS:10 [Cetraspora pellucida]